MVSVAAGTYVHQPLHPCSRSIRRFIARSNNNAGNCNAFHRTGNRDPVVLKGEDRFLLATYRVIFPKATANEIIAFIHAHSSAPRLYSRSQNSECEQDLGLSRKVGATDAHQAFYPVNIQRRIDFWTTGYPTGITDSRFIDFIDMDEMSIELRDTNRKNGKAYLDVQVREEGSYSRTGKWTLMLAIAPDPYPLGRVWYRFTQDRGTTAENFRDFTLQVLDSFKGVYSRPHTLLWDNLRSHHSPLVMNVKMLFFFYFTQKQLKVKGLQI